MILHKIRYELLGLGDELWLVADGERELVGRVTQCKNCGAWVVQVAGQPAAAARDADAARELLAAHFHARRHAVMDLT